MLIITFVYHLLALTVDVTYYHIRCCGVIWSAFTFSEELGSEEGGHGGLLSPCKLKSGNIRAVGAPLTPFYGDLTSSDPVEPLHSPKWLETSMRAFSIGLD